MSVATAIEGARENLADALRRARLALLGIDNPIGWTYIQESEKDMWLKRADDVMRGLA